MEDVNQMTMAVIRWPSAVYAARSGRHQQGRGEQHGRKKRSFNGVFIGYFSV